MKKAEVEMEGQVRKFAQLSKQEVMVTQRKEGGFLQYLADRIYLVSVWVCEERHVFLAKGTEVGYSGRGTSLGRLSTYHRHSFEADNETNSIASFSNNLGCS